MSMRAYRNPMVGSSISRAGQTLMGIGLDLSQRLYDQQYASEKGILEAKNMEYSIQLDKDLHDNRDNPSNWDKIFEESFNLHTKDRMAGITNPRLKREAANQQRLERAVLYKEVMEKARAQSIRNNAESLKVMEQNLHQTIPSIKTPEMMLNRMGNFVDAYDKIADVLNISEEGKREYLDKTFSPVVAKFTMNNPHKTNEEGEIVEGGEDYWPNHLNEFVDLHDLNVHIDGRPMFTEEEQAQYSGDYQARKNNKTRINKEKRDLRHEKNGRNIISRLMSEDPNDDPTPDEISQAVHPDNDLISVPLAFQIYNALSKESAKITDLNAYDEVKNDILYYKRFPSPESREKAEISLVKNKPKLSHTDAKGLSNELYTAINKADTQDEVEAYRIMADFLGGVPDPTDLSGMIFSFFNEVDRKAWLAAKIEWDAEIKRAVDMDKPLDRTKKRIAAVRIAQRVKGEMEGKSLEEFLSLPKEGYKINIQPEGTPAGYIMGKQWGTHDGKGNVILTIAGIRELVKMYNGNEEKIREHAKRKGYIIPGQFIAPEGALHIVKTKEDFEALPAGAVFIAPDGSMRRKK